MSPATVARLYNDVPEVCAIKEATGSLDIASEIRSLCDITILSGDDSLTLPLMSIGGKGVISVLSNLSPKAMTDVTGAALKGDWEKARAAHLRNFHICKAMFQDPNPCPMKAALAAAKVIQTSHVRLPLVPSDDKVLTVIQHQLQEKPQIMGGA